MLNWGVPFIFGLGFVWFGQEGRSRVQIWIVCPSANTSWRLTASAELQVPLPVAAGPGAPMLSNTHQAAQPTPAMSPARTTNTTASAIQRRRRPPEARWDVLAIMTLSGPCSGPAG